MEEKCIRWIGSSRKNLLAFPVDARKEAGYQLSLVQLGDDPEDWKPMRGMGMGGEKSEFIKTVNFVLSMLPRLRRQYTCYMPSPKKRNRLQREILILQKPDFAN